MVFEALPSLRLARIASALMLAVIVLAPTAPAIAETDPVLQQCERIAPEDDPFLKEGRKGSEIDPALCSSAFPAADVANAVYKDGAARQAALYGQGVDYVRDWPDLVPAGDGRADAISRAGKSGFEAGVFEDNANNVVYVAFRGTEGKWNDIGTDLGRGVGATTTQYELAELVAENAVAKYAGTGKKVVFVGHSLGGGLANHAALHTGLPATSFNADGITAAAARRLENGEGSNIENIYMTGDPLHAPMDWQYSIDPMLSPGVNIARNLGIAVGKAALSQPGNLHWLPTKDACVGDGISGILESHRMTTVLRTLNYCIADAAAEGELPPRDAPIQGTAAVVAGDSDKPDRPAGSGSSGKPPTIVYECRLSC